jgi:surfeit locus 1 family protein
MIRGARALLWPAVAAALAFALLVGLGLWQVRRLAEKEALIARVESRVHVAAQDLPPRDRWASLAPPDYDFTHVRTRGHYLTDRDAHIFMQAPAGFGREPGYMVVTPFAVASGGVVLVERGFVPNARAEDAADAAPSTDEIEISGLMRAPQSRNLFTPADTPERRIWYTRDPKSIAAALALSEAAPFTLALEAPSSAGASGFPRRVETTPEIVNNHLSYAFTWFSLALALLVVFVLFARGRLMRAAAFGPK